MLCVSQFPTQHSVRLIVLLAFLFLGCGKQSTVEVEQPLQSSATQVTLPTPSPEESTSRILSLTESVRNELSPDSHFSLGLDRLVREDYIRLNGKRISVVTSRLALDSNGEHLLQTLLPKRTITVTRVVLLDDELPSPARDNELSTLLASYPEVRIFGRGVGALTITDLMVEDTDVILVDLPYRGFRGNPEFALMGSLLEKCHQKNLRVMILDRPIPITGGLVSAPIGSLDKLRSPESYFPVPAIPGLTLGEFTLMYNKEFGLSAKVEVVEMLFWNRFKGAQQLIDQYESLGIKPWESYEEWNNYYSTNQHSSELRIVLTLLGDLVSLSEDGTSLVIPAETNRAELENSLNTNLKSLGVINTSEEKSISVKNEASINPVVFAFAIALSLDPYNERPLVEELLGRMASPEVIRLANPQPTVQSLMDASSFDERYKQFTRKRQGYFLYSGQ